MESRNFTERDVFEAFGRAAKAAQKLECKLRAFHMLEFASACGWDEKALNNKANKLTKATFGQLLQESTSSGDHQEDMKERFDRSRRLRNVLMHHFFLARTSEMESKFFHPLVIDLNKIEEKFKMDSELLDTIHKRRFYRDKA